MIRAWADYLDADQYPPAKPGDFSFFVNRCPLCLNDSISPFYRDRVRAYFRCRHCWLVFVPREQHLHPSAEKALYDLHENHANDGGYRRFLSRLSIPLLARLPAHAHGLDFGCGPGPLLAEMLREQGHRVEIYDPFYADHPQLLQQRYDFVSCTEVVEHFRQPRTAFESLFALLKPNGLLGIMTKLVIDAQAFSRWHYKNDPTHVCFFSETTLHWLAGNYRCQIELIGADVFIFRAG